MICTSSSVGRTSLCQGEGRGFETHLVLQLIIVGISRRVIEVLLIRNDMEGCDNWLVGLI